jgi:hypothetical protein
MISIPLSCIAAALRAAEVAAGAQDSHEAAAAAARAGLVLMATLLDGGEPDEDHDDAAPEEAEPRLFEELRAPLETWPALLARQAPRPGACWNDDRDQLLARLWREPGLRMPDLMQRLNALPGAEIRHDPRVYVRAKKLGLGGRGLLLTVTPDAGNEDADARALIVSGKGARAIAEDLGWSLDRAQKFAERVRQEMFNPPVDVAHA